MGFVFHPYEIRNTIILVHVVMFLVLGCLSVLVAAMVWGLGLGSALGQHRRFRSGRALCCLDMMLSPGGSLWANTWINLWDDQHGSKYAKAHEHQVSEYKGHYDISTH